MSEGARILDPEETTSVLSAALREIHGDEARLEDWIAIPLAKHGKRRAFRYDLRVGGVQGVDHLQWVGKVFGSDEEPGRVATVLRELAATDCGARGAVVLPRVIAYDERRRLLVSSYEPGESIVAAMSRHDGPVVLAIGRALAALHAAPVGACAITSPACMLRDLRAKMANLSVWSIGTDVAAGRILHALERDVPLPPAAPSFLHGDVGLCHLLWRRDEIVLLDFDKWTRGDPAADLGNLLTQLHRLTLRKPGKLPDFAPLRSALLAAYQCWAPPDPELAARVAWYERLALARKAHFLASNTTRHHEPEVLLQRRSEAIRLLQEASGASSEGTHPEDLHAA